MGDPKYSVVIPTRERHETLPHAVRSVLAQEECDEFELIVMDNASSPETAEAMAPFLDDPRLKYVRAEQRVCMSDNWDRAMEHVSGQYVTYIGDDDALMPDCLKICDCLIEQLAQEVVSWVRTTVYWWPSTNVPWHRNRLYVNLQNQGLSLQGRDVLEYSFTALDSTFLPEIYNSMVHRDVFDRIRDRTGRYFPHPIPDIFSGVAVAHFCESFVFLLRSLGVAGNSAKSTGTGSCYRSRNAKWIDKFRQENPPEMDALFVHPELGLPERYGAADTLAATFLHARDMLFPDSGLQVDMRSLLRMMLDRLSWDGGQYDRFLEGARLFARLHGFGIDETKLPKRPDKDPSPMQGLLNPTTLAINGDLAGISNVYEATRLAASMLPGAGGLTIKAKNLCDHLRKVA